MRADRGAGRILPRNPRVGWRGPSHSPPAGGAAAMALLA